MSEFKKRFSSKLEAMRGWIPNMKVGEHPSLAAQEAKLADLEAELSEKAKLAAEMKASIEKAKTG